MLRIVNHRHAEGAEREVHIYIVLGHVELKAETLQNDLRERLLRGVPSRRKQRRLEHLYLKGELEQMIMHGLGDGETRHLEARGICERMERVLSSESRRCVPVTCARKRSSFSRRAGRCIPPAALGIRR